MGVLISWAMPEARRPMACMRRSWESRRRRALMAARSWPRISTPGTSPGRPSGTGTGLTVSPSRRSAPSGVRQAISSTRAGASLARLSARAWLRASPSKVRPREKNGRPTHRVGPQAQNGLGAGIEAPDPVVAVQGDQDGADGTEQHLDVATGQVDVPPGLVAPGHVPRDLGQAEDRPGLGQGMAYRFQHPHLAVRADLLGLPGQAAALLQGLGGQAGPAQVAGPAGRPGAGAGPARSPRALRSRRMAGLTSTTVSWAIEKADAAVQGLEQGFEIAGPLGVHGGGAGCGPIPCRRCRWKSAESVVSGSRVMLRPPPATAPGPLPRTGAA